jgi:hypothetical protein
MMLFFHLMVTYVYKNKKRLFSKNATLYSILEIRVSKGISEG